MLRLLALRGMAVGIGEGYSPAQALIQFRNLTLNVMESFPRDPRPLSIFFQYATNRFPDPSALPASDMNILDLTLRRLPFLIETDPELIWMAAPFMSDIDEARRFVGSYRAGGISHIQNRDFRPHPGSIPVALNLGLLGDFEAIEEMFSGSRGFNYPLPANITGDGNPVLKKEILNNVYRLLRSEEGRHFFTQKLLSFSGTIYSDDDNDGFVDSLVKFNSGIILSFQLDRNQSNIFDLQILMDDGSPSSAMAAMIGQNVFSHITWERYPYVRRAVIETETFQFGPADFHYAPITFIELGGSNILAGILFPVPAYQYIDITQRSLLSFSSSLSRPSSEIERAVETIYLNRGVILQVVEYLNNRQVSVTEFERGLPVIQYIDLDLDGRMETIRRFRQPPQGYQLLDLLNYRTLIASSESDWSGDGRYKTREVYLEDGSIVYYFDMDGSGEWTYLETRSGN